MHTSLFGRRMADIQPAAPPLFVEAVPARKPEVENSL
jgi:hypothetical protein